jgi:hypothetical protein
MNNKPSRKLINVSVMIDLQQNLQWNVVIRVSICQNYHCYVVSKGKQHLFASDLKTIN